MVALIRFSLLTCALCCSSIGLCQYKLEWARQFDGPAHRVDDFSEMVIDPRGNIYAAGSVNVDAPAGSDIALVKYSPTGSVLWSLIWDGPAHGQDTAFHAVYGDDGFVYVVGRTITLTTSSDFVTLKVNPTTGAIVWSRLYDGPDSSIDEALGAAVDKFGNVYVTGEVWVDHIPYSNGDYCTIKYDSTGELKWAKTYNGPANYIAISDQPQTIAIDHSGDVIVSGNSPFSDNADDVVTIKYRASDGLELWSTRFNGLPTSQYQQTLAIASNNDVIMGFNDETSGLFVNIVRYSSATGGTVWQRAQAFPHGGRLRGRSTMAIDSSDNIAIALTYDPDFDESNLNYNIQVTKYGFETGAQLWSTSYGTTARLNGQSADAVTFDRKGNVVVAGSDLFVPNNVASIWKFDGASGSLVWRGTYNGPKQPDKTSRVRVDADGNIIAAGITGVSAGTGSSDLQVFKFSDSRSPIRPH